MTRVMKRKCYRNKGDQEHIGSTFKQDGSKKTAERVTSESRAKGDEAVRHVDKPASQLSVR